jgi:hypothetical protein
MKPCKEIHGNFTPCDLPSLILLLNFQPLLSVIAQFCGPGQLSFLGFCHSGEPDSQGIPTHSRQHRCPAPCWLCDTAARMTITAAFSVFYVLDRDLIPAHGLVHLIYLLKVSVMWRLYHKTGCKE